MPNCTLIASDASLGGSSGAGGGCPWIAEFKLYLLKRIAEFEEPQEDSTMKTDWFWPLAEPLGISSGSDPNQPMSEIVLLSGTLANYGTVANCIVRATKVTIPSLQDTQYINAAVALAPPYLPDGQYELHFEDRRIRFRNNGGRWSRQDPAATPRFGHGRDDRHEEQLRMAVIESSYK